MNKVTPRLLRDLHATLPEGTECYLCESVRKALMKYRKGYESAFFLEKEQALRALAEKLGRGLNRYFHKDISEALSKPIHLDMKRSA